MTVESLSVIKPDWPAPANIVAACTTRLGGGSEAPYASLNPASHVGDDRQRVEHNRQLITRHLALPAQPLWLNQVHGTQIAGFEQNEFSVPEADAVIARQSNQVCVVQTADCLPLLICDSHGREVAAVHAGWRGLVQGIISKVMAEFEADAGQLLVWLGPAISQRFFEVGPEVREAFVSLRESNENAFIDASKPGHYLADLYALARNELHSLGVQQIYGGEHCTYADKKHFYSYRRDGQTGRMASLIYRKS